MVDSPVAIFLLMTLDEVPKNVNNIESLARQFDILSRQKERLGTADFCVATDGYFQALGIPLLRGRIFDERDGPNSPHVPLRNIVRLILNRKRVEVDPGLRLQGGHVAA